MVDCAGCVFREVCVSVFLCFCVSLVRWFVGSCAMTMGFGVFKNILEAILISATFRFRQFVGSCGMAGTAGMTSESETNPRDTFLEDELG